MTKYFVLRPHALLSSEDSLQKFGEDNVIVVPLAIVDEVQSMKNLNPEKAKVRGIILKYLRKAAKNGALTDKGYVQENGSILKIEVNQKDIPIDIPNITEFQKRTLQVCLGIQKTLKNQASQVIKGVKNNLETENKGGEKSKDVRERVILITNNTALQIKAYTVGIKAEPFKDEIFPELAQQYKGKMTICVSKEIVEILRNKGEIEIAQIYNRDEYEWVENCIVILNNPDGHPTFSVVKGKKLVFQNPYKAAMYGVKPKTEGQAAYVCALTSGCPLIVAKGTAGTGKTLLALANSLEGYEKMEFRRINITSPVFNDELGYLPGDIDDKVSPFLSGIMHNLEYLLSNRKQDDIVVSKETKNTSKEQKLSFSKDKPNHDWTKPIKEDGSYYFEKGIIKILALRALRGASIMDEIFIVDEAQNIEPKDMKTIITRMGEGSKIIICGDPTQVDHPGLDERYNGIVYVAEKMKGSVNTMVITFEEDETVRGALAKEAAERL